MSGQDNVGEESTIVYNNDYFAQWSPVTAQDMIDRIPGLTEGAQVAAGLVVQVALVEVSVGLGVGVVVDEVSAMVIVAVKY